MWPGGVAVKRAAPAAVRIVDAPELAEAGAA